MELLNQILREGAFEATNFTCFQMKGHTLKLFLSEGMFFCGNTFYLILANK